MCIMYMWKQPVIEDKPNYMYMYDITIVFIVVANPKVIKMCEICTCVVSLRQLIHVHV